MPVPFRTNSCGEIQTTVTFHSPYNDGWLDIRLMYSQIDICHKQVCVHCLHLELADSPLYLPRSRQTNAKHLCVFSLNNFHSLNLRPFFRFREWLIKRLAKVVDDHTIGGAGEGEDSAPIVRYMSKQKWITIWGAVHLVGQRFPDWITVWIRKVIYCSSPPDHDTLVSLSSSARAWPGQMMIKYKIVLIWICLHLYCEITAPA